MSAQETIPLLEVEPDLGRFLTDADRQTLRDLRVPVVSAPAEEFDVAALLASHRAFAAILLDGVILRRIAVAENTTLRLLGPGDLLAASSVAASMLIASTGWRAAAPTRLALLGREVLLAAHHAPRLVAGLQARGAEQSDRVGLQLAICQLPRVEDRVLSMLWLLAESWGQVTAHGTALRLRLTHELLGGLVGARRSTITLALGQLTDDGAITRVDNTWMLLAPPPVFAAAPASVPMPELAEALQGLQPAAPAPLEPGKVLERVRELRDVRDELARARDVIQRRTLEDLARARALREHSIELRRQAAERRRAEGSRVSRFHHHDGAGDPLGPVEGQADDAAADRPPAPVHRLER